VRGSKAINSYSTPAQTKANLALKDALETVLSKGELKTRPLSFWLAKNVDRVVDGLVLRRLSHTKAGVLWRAAVPPCREHLT
jgi:hypothetical protein